MNHVFSLPLEIKSRNMVVYPTVLQDESELILVDCGFPGFMPVIDTELKKHGVSISDVTRIIITHHDHDHVGGLKEIHDAFPGVEILCSEEQAPYVTGKEKSLRLAQAEKRQESLPESEKEENRKYIEMLASVRYVDQVSGVSAGEVLPWCGGIEVVDTKGHMPGHISLYVREQKTLIAGDALTVENGRLCMSVQRFTLNREDAVESAGKLLQYDIGKIICYHGGEFTGDIKSSLQRII